MIELNKIYNENCLEGMKRIPDKTVDAIVTDPPYLYLKHKLDREWDEDAVFEQWNRILKDDGFIVIFGRGISFYRWNVKLNELGFEFKEEVIWDKRASSGPLLKLSRVHETVSLLTKTGTINRIKIPYTEKNFFNLDLVINDVNTLASALHNSKKIKEIKYYLENQKTIKHKGSNKHGITGYKTTVNDRSVDVIKSIEEGKMETSIMRVKKEHYRFVHATQKPVRLMERLLNLVSEPGNVVLDPFSGSGSTAVACQNLNRNYIGFEIDKEYYDKSLERIKNNVTQLDLFEEAK
ncbi:site-specific DNA-methyltransferase [Lactococcus sp. DD01]|uniref:DNA-methyltransferase n=1 Tax=Lactococcus sp. DD01 TaxID=1776443 RepID=UPI0007951A95|nr:site-specific DNA-methyltransferase [Lactococcus sp. DD01]KXT61397.1 Modification methylase [Lactococcus sp. DD01]